MSSVNSGPGDVSEVTQKKVGSQDHVRLGGTCGDSLIRPFRGRLVLRKRVSGSDRGVSDTVCCVRESVNFQKVGDRG